MTTDPRAIRMVVDQIRGALEGYQREELIEILTYVFKTYVVEGGSPLVTGAGVQLDARSELDGLSFAQLVTWLQQHLDAPELALFEVQGDRVGVRVGGRSVAIEAPRQEPVAPPPPVVAAPVAAPAPVTAQAASVTQQAAPAPAAPAAAQPEPAKAEETPGPDSRFKRLEVD